MVNQGDPAECVDLVFVAEGYKENQMDSFYTDVERFSNYILSTKPFNQYREKFNIWTVASISQDDGTDFPVKESGKPQYLILIFIHSNLTGTLQPMITGRFVM